MPASTLCSNDRIAPSGPVITVSAGKAVIRLSRPNQHNRFEATDLAALAAMFEAVEQDEAARVLVITASGPTFSSGFDIGALAAGLDSPGAGDDHEFGRLCDRLEALRVPTICALNGSVYGGATDFALACDLRIGVEGMCMFMPASRLGIHYYYGGLRRYVERLGPSAAKRLFLTAEQIDAEAMFRIGFLDEIVASDALEARVEVVAAALAEGAPGAVQGMKASLNEIARGCANPAAIQARFSHSLRSADVREGLKAWAEKRKPQFKGH